MKREFCLDLKMDIEPTAAQGIEESLEGRLNQKSVDSASADRVRKAIKREVNYPGNQFYGGIFEALEDYLLYLEIHEEWQGKTISEMQHNLGKSARSFYNSFCKFLLETISDRSERKRIKSRFFKRKPTVSARDRKTIGEWKAEYARHPEWHNKSPSQLERDNLSGGSNFYNSFIRWVPRQESTPSGRRKLITLVFGDNYTLKYSYRTIEEWKAKYDEHPEWHGRSSQEMRTDKDLKSRSFYFSFERWATRNSDSKKEKYRLIETLFTLISKNRSGYELSDWIEEYQSHPEWHGLSPRQMSKSGVPGACGFYNSLCVWAKKTANNETARRKIMVQIIGTNYRFIRVSNTMEQWKAEYEKHPEWHGKSAQEMREDKNSEGYRFLNSFLWWVHKNSSNNAEKHRLTEQFFRLQHKDRSDYEISDWVQEFKMHPEWNGLTPSQLDKEKATGGRGFYISLLKWVNEKSDTAEERAQLMQQIFPNYSLRDTF